MKSTTPSRSTRGGDAIVWSALRRRLATAQAGLSLSVEQKQTLLRTRAQALAQEPAPRTEAAEFLEVVGFVLAHERYAVESSFVREVYPLKAFTPLPGTPPFVLGLVNIRGQILSVLDLKKFFELPAKGLTDLNKVIVLRNQTMEFGILADAVSGVRTVLRSDLQPSLPTLTGVREQYLKGVTQERLIILDGEKLLSDKKLVLEENDERSRSPL